MSLSASKSDSILFSVNTIRFFIRKTWPMAFSDILSHDREGSILRRAVKGDRVAHAYLFAGIDGIGKENGGPRARSLA